MYNHRRRNLRALIPLLTCFEFAPMTDSSSSQTKMVQSFISGAHIFSIISQKYDFAVHHDLKNTDFTPSPSPLHPIHTTVMGTLDKRRLHMFGSWMQMWSCMMAALPWLQQMHLGDLLLTSALLQQFFGHVKAQRALTQPGQENAPTPTTPPPTLLLSGTNWWSGWIFLTDLPWRRMIDGPLNL